MTVRIVLFAMVLLFLGCSNTPREGVYHTVEKGQTLYRISRAYGVDERYLARLNGVEDPSKLEAGQLIYIPSAPRVLSIPPTPAPPAPALRHSALPAPVPAEQKSSPAALASSSKSPPAAPHTPALPPRKQVPSSGGRESPSVRVSPPPIAPSVSSGALTATKQGDRGKFEWPVRGRVTRNFGNTGQQSSQGIEIAAPSGSPILSASDGTVTYSGDGIRGYGNLIILKHDEPYFTVYAFNQKNLVKAGARVAKGEKIALSGANPSTGKEALHFEIRRGKTAVNPIFYLP